MEVKCCTATLRSTLFPSAHNHAMFVSLWNSQILSKHPFLALPLLLPLVCMTLLSYSALIVECSLLSLYYRDHVFTYAVLIHE